MDGVLLPADLEQFAAEEVAAGRYRDTADVIRAALDLLKQRAQARNELLASVLAAQEEGNRLGYLSSEDVAAHVRQTIARRAGTAV